MNPLRLRVEGYGRFERFDLDIPEGLCSIVGPNGSGKSRLLSAIELALFAADGRDLAPWLAPFADRLLIELQFEHAGELYRVRRGYQQGSGGRGKTTLDLDHWKDQPLHTGDDTGPCWEPLTREKAEETQKLIEQTIGLSRRTFGASSFLAQGDAAAFPDASPADRKAILGEILDPHGLWPRLALQARDDAKACDVEVAAARVLIGQHEQTAAGLADTAAEISDLETQVGDLTSKLADADRDCAAARDALSANAAAAERARAASQARQAAAAALERAQADARKAMDAAVAAARCREEIAEREPVAARIPVLEQAVQSQRDEAARAEAATAEKRRLAADADGLDTQAGTLGREAAALRTEAEGLYAKATELALHQHDDATCDACGQALSDPEARLKVIAGLDGQGASLLEKAAHKDAQAEPLVAQAAVARESAGAIAIPERGPDLAPELAAARKAAERVVELRVLIDGHDRTAAETDDRRIAVEDCEADLAERDRELAEATDGVHDTTKLQAAVSATENALTALRHRLDAARATLVRTQERHARQTEAAQAASDLNVKVEELLGSLDLYRIAEKLCGRDGVPVMLVENVIPQIEAEANRVLEQMPTVDGAVLTVELRTQRENKTTDTVRETLDIVVSDPDGERAYETYSGGERGRLNFALRISLARLLAHRRGAESRLLAIDELEYLDELGQEQLVQVIRSVAGDFDRVLVVSHSPNVRDAFDATIQVAKADGVSSLVQAAAFEAVAA